MKVLILTFFKPHQFQCPIGDHFVGVHIGRGTCAALNNIDDKLTVPLATNNFVAGRRDSLSFCLSQNPKIAIGQRAGLFDHG